MFNWLRSLEGRKFPASKPRPPRTIVAIERDDGGLMTFDPPVSVYQAIEAKRRGE